MTYRSQLIMTSYSDVEGILHQIHQQKSGMPAWQCVHIVDYVQGWV